MDGTSIAATIISLIISALSITFCILAFARNKTNDSKEIETRLTKIETDILYIRQSIDKDENWKSKTEEKIQHHEIRLLDLERRHK